MGDFEAAAKQHRTDLDISSELAANSGKEEESSGGGGLLEGVARALCNLGSAHESLGHADEAVRFYDRHLGVANQLDDPAARTQV